MKFNDKELAKWSTMFTPDKEGLLEKKGAGKGQGRLKLTPLPCTSLIFKFDQCFVDTDSNSRDREEFVKSFIGRI